MLDDSIRANIAFGEEDVSDDEVWRALEEAALDDFVKTLPDGLDTQIGERNETIRRSEAANWNCFGKCLW